MSTLFSQSQLIELIHAHYTKLDEVRTERVFTWIADPNIRAQLSAFAADAISNAAKKATEIAVGRCLDAIAFEVHFGQLAAKLYAHDPGLAQKGLHPDDVLYAFRSLLQEQDFELDEEGTLNLEIPAPYETQEEEPTPAPPPPAPDPEDAGPSVTVTEEHRATVQKGIKELAKEINAGVHDGILWELLAAENEREEPRKSAIATLRTRLAWMKTRSG